jgi:FtsH-binding integral membrane protein
MFNNRAIIKTAIRQFNQTPKKPLVDTVPKSIKYGIYFTGGCGALGLSYTLKNAFMPTATSNLHSVGFWPDYVKQRISGTFSYCLSGIGVTTGAAMMTLRSPSMMKMMGNNSMIAMLGCIAAMYGTGYLCQTTPFNGSPFGTKALFYYLHQAVVGAVIAPIALLGGEACIMAAGLTAAVMAGLSVTAMVAPSDAYVKTYGIVNAGCFLMLGACVMSMFMNPVGAAGMGLNSFIVFGGLGLFSFKGFSDINRCIDHAKRPGQYDPINHSVHITMDAINIFIRLAMIMSGNKKK